MCVCVCACYLSEIYWNLKAVYYWEVSLIIKYPSWIIFRRPTQGRCRSKACAKLRSVLFRTPKGNPTNPRLIQNACCEANHGYPHPPRLSTHDDDIVPGLPSGKEGANNDATLFINPYRFLHFYTVTQRGRVTAWISAWNTFSLRRVFINLNVGIDLGPLLRIYILYFYVRSEL